MAFTEYGGADELFWLARKANPTIPATLNQSTCYFPKLVTADELATVTMAGKYNSGVRGYVELDYTRLDLAKLFKNGPMKIGVLTAKPLLELLDDIYLSTGYRFDVTDLVPVTPAADQTLPWRVVLKAAKTSFIYYGEVEVELVSRKEFLTEAMSVRDIDAVLEWNPGYSINANKRAEILTFGVDYTNKHKELATFELGNMNQSTAEVMRDILNDIDQLPWRADPGSTDWGLTGATVVFNGKPEDYDPVWWGSADVRRPNRRYDRVLVIDWTVNWSGGISFCHGTSAFIHYNSPLDNEVLDGNS